MLLAILFACFSFVAAEIVTVGSTNYTKTFLFNLNGPFRKDVVITQLAHLYSSNLLYYAFEPELNDPEYYKIGYHRLDNTGINGVLKRRTEKKKNFRTIAIDQESDSVFFGGSNGIYYAGPTNYEAAYFCCRNNNNYFVRIFIHRHILLYVQEGENLIVEIVSKELGDGQFNETFLRYPQYKNVKNFVIGRHKNIHSIIVFLNTTGLYANKFLTDQTVYLSKQSFFRGLTVDKHGTVYAWWVDGIYKVNIEDDFKKTTIVRVAEIESIGAMTFDVDNNILYTIKEGLYKLTKIPPFRRRWYRTGVHTYS